MGRDVRLLSIVVLAWAAAAWPQRPADADVDAALAQARRKALDYTRSLPDFVCTEIVQRFYDTRLRGAWVQLDKLTVKLSYFDRKEEHKLVLIDDKPTDRDYNSLQGASGVGEFGGTLQSIFDPASQASFHWQGWRTVHRRRAAVYSYVVAMPHSNYVLETGSRVDVHKAIVGYHGVLEIDSETGAVFHFTYDADSIPKELSLDFVRSKVDYDTADVGGREYLLPSRSETEMGSPRLWSWNKMEFRDYRKFESESTITFGEGK